MAGTLVIAELGDGKVKKSTHSAITFAKQAGAPFAILVIGAGAANAAKATSRSGSKRSTAFTRPRQATCRRSSNGSEVWA